jgi:hypothetical protein
VIKILGETHDVDSWADVLTVAVAAVLRDVDDHERITEIDGRTRSYFTEGVGSQIYPIPDGFRTPICTWNPISPRTTVSGRSSR